MGQHTETSKHIAQRRRERYVKAVVLVRTIGSEPAGKGIQDTEDQDSNAPCEKQVLKALAVVGEILTEGRNRPFRVVPYPAVILPLDFFLADVEIAGVF